MSVDSYGIHIGSQNANNIKNYQITITSHKDLEAINSSLLSIKEELFKIDLPKGIDREKLVKPISELLENKEAQQDKNIIKERIEKFNDNLSLIGKTITGIATISPYVSSIAKVIGIPLR